MEAAVGPARRLVAEAHSGAGAGLHCLAGGPATGAACRGARPADRAGRYRGNHAGAQPVIQAAPPDIVREHLREMRGLRFEPYEAGDFNAYDAGDEEIVDSSAEEVDW